MRRFLWLLILSPMLLIGCKRDQAPAGPQGKPEVKVSFPLVDDVVDYEYFTGHSEAFRRVDLRARVTGHLEEIKFTDGEIVKEDELLFVVDQKPFKAQLAKAEADLKQSDARRKRMQADFARAQSLLPRGGVSQEEFDLARGNRDEAIEAVGSARETVNLAAQNLKYSEVRAPFAGRISRRLIDKGNMVKQDDTILTTIVDLEKIYAYFDVDERTLLRNPSLKKSRSGLVKIDIGLADEQGYPHTGTVDFVDNTIDINTGTIWMRGVIDKPSDGQTARDLTPGMFIRVRFPVGPPQRSVRVAEQAISTDQGQKFVNVLNDKDQVEYRQVTVGRLEGGLRVIKGEKFAFAIDDPKDPRKYRLVTDPKLMNGPNVVKSDLKPDERIVVSGLQRAKEHMEVKPIVEPMPIRDGSTKPTMAAGKDNPAKDPAPTEK